MSAPIGNSPTNALDQIVKGAPSPNTTLSAVAASAVSPSAPSPALAASLHESKKPSLAHAIDEQEDPEAALPSSPNQIYLNLLILEASLRAQHLTLRARRRQHTFFLLLLSIWTTFFFYGLFLRPREDGKGIGGSVYWVVDMAEKVAFMGGILTMLLMWATGQWERGVRWPRRWLGVTNRGLRGMNMKVVVLRGPWWSRILDQLALVFPYSSLFGRAHGSEFRLIDYPPDKKPSSDSFRHGYKHRGTREEDVAPGGDAIKLLLLPKHFSPEFRENWDLYRTEYWDRENERRAQLRKFVHTRERELAKVHGGFFWWTGWRRGWGAAPPPPQRTKPPAHLDKTAHPHTHQLAALRGAPKEPKKRRGSSLQSGGGGGGGGGGSHSRSSSRSSTITPEPDEMRGPAALADGRSHRRHKSNLSALSTIPSASSKSTSSSARRSRLSDETGVGVGVHESSSPTLHKRASTVSNASSSSANDSEVSERSTTSTPGLSQGPPGSLRPRLREDSAKGLHGEDA